MDELRWRALFSGQEIQPQRPPTCLQTHENAFITCGGLSPDGLVRNMTLCYVPTDKTWYQLAPMLSRRRRHRFTACQGFFYAIGGKGEDSFHCSVERYDPRTNTWSYVASLAKKVKLVGAATLQGFCTLWVVSSSLLNRVEDAVTLCRSMIPQQILGLWLPH